MFGSFLPSLGCLAAIKSTQVEEADIVMKSSGGASAVAGCWPTCRESHMPIFWPTSWCHATNPESEIVGFSLGSFLDDKQLIHAKTCFH
jgi:hypothetical protein